MCDTRIGQVQSGKNIGGFASCAGETKELAMAKWYSARRLLHGRIGGGGICLQSWKKVVAVAFGTTGLRTHKAEKGRENRCAEVEKHEPLTTPKLAKAGRNWQVYCRLASSVQRQS
jgi:hypothetical protein